MDSVESKKYHAVFVPFPAQGHITPMMQLANQLHSKGFHITFVNTEFNHRRLIRSKGLDFIKGLPDFQFETIPDGLPPSDRDATQDIGALFASIRKSCLAPFMELLSKLNSPASCCTNLPPPVTCVVADGIMGFAVKAARMLGILDVQVWTASACGMMAYLQFTELHNRGIIPFEDENFLNDGTLDTPIDWIPGMSNMRLKDFPSFMRITDVNDIMYDYLGSETQYCLKSSAIVFNTFDELEQQVIDAIASKFPNIYTVGPLPLLCKQLDDTKSKPFGSSLWKEDSECLKWLDGKAPNSVVYVNYGSITVMTEQHLKEFAWGLGNSKHPFLWIVRPDVVMGESGVLPEEYFEEIKGRGFIASWCQQQQVLSHPSVGAFLTHCGWNSTIESISAGVPVICWPFFAEQQTNCRYACTDWGTGMEVNNDVKRDEIEALVKKMMEGDEGKKMRQNAQNWKKKAEAATAIGGQSYNNLDKFVNWVIRSHK